MNHELSIKVCGMREACNIRAVEQLGVRWLGFIFWPGSARFVSAPPAYLPTQAERVGVFVDQDIDTLVHTAHRYALHAIQLHGSESADYLHALRERLAGSASAIALIKAFSIANASDLVQTRQYEGAADYFLFDTKSHLPGGSGHQFDWSVLTAYHGTTPFLLSGGIGPDDAARIRSFRHPRCIGIDLNSRFELSAGLKDVAALRRFINETTHLTLPSS